MEHHKFIPALKLLVDAEKPGPDAQMLMSRFGRNQIGLEKARLASVLLLLFVKNQQFHFILTKRTSNSPNDKHGGQISFPGGSKDHEDENLQITAIRETFEEIGVEKEQIEIIGELTELYIPVSNFLVQPYIGVTNTIEKYNPQPKEVEDVLEIPLEMLLNESSVKSKNITINKGMVLKDVPYFDFYGHVVWGATAMILSEFKEVVKKIQVK